MTEKVLMDTLWKDFSLGSTLQWKSLILCLLILLRNKSPPPHCWLWPNSHRQVRALTSMRWCVDVEIQAVLGHGDGRHEVFSHLQTLWIHHIIILWTPGDNGRQLLRDVGSQNHVFVWIFSQTLLAPFLQDVPLKHECALKPFPTKIKATGSVLARIEPDFQKCLHLGEDMHMFFFLSQGYGEL